MITTLYRPRTWRFLAIAVVLSLIVHFLGGIVIALLGMLYARVVPVERHAGPIVPPEIITLDRRPPPPPATAVHVRVVKPLPPPPPRSVAPRVLPKPRPVQQIAHGLPLPIPHVRHEIAHIVKHAATQVADAGKIAAYRQATTPGAKTSQLSAEQIAALNEKFSQTITDSHTDVESVAKSVQTTPTYTQKHYTASFSSGVSGLRPGDGTIEWISRERRGNTMWYYTHYTYRYADGHIEEDDIPWPFHYPINDDPFARHDLRIPLQPPPEGFVPNRPLKPILQQYFGGPPAQ